MKNFVAIGDRIEFVAGATVNAGDAVVIGTLIGICAQTVYSGQTGIANLTGVYRLTKLAGEAWALGAKVYWDAGNKRCTTTVGANTLLGGAAAAALSADTVGNVRLNGVTV